MTLLQAEVIAPSFGSWLDRWAAYAKSAHVVAVVEHAGAELTGVRPCFPSLDGCHVDVAFETQEDSAGGYTRLHGKPFGTITGARRWRWPAAQRTPGAVLHANILIVAAAERS